MKILRFPTLIAVTLSLAALPAAWAQPPVGGLQESFQPSPYDDPEAVRSELAAVLRTYRHLCRELRLDDLEVSLQHAEELLRVASAEELAQFSQLMPELGQLAGSAAELSASLATPSPDQPVEEQSTLGAVAGRFGTFPDGSYSICGRFHPDPVLVILLRQGIFVAETVRESFSRACNQTVVVAGFGGNSSVVCIITDIIFVVAKTVVDFSLQCVDDVNRAEIHGSFERLGHIHGDLEASSLLLSSQIDGHDRRLASDLAAHHGDLQARTNQLASDLAAHDAHLDTLVADLSTVLRADLRKLQDSIIDLAVTSGKSTPTLFTPVCQNPDGLLEKLRQRLVTALCDYRDLGEKGASLSIAYNKLSDGDQELDLLTPALVDLCLAAPVSISCPPVSGSYVAGAGRYLEALQALSK